MLSHSVRPWFPSASRPDVGVRRRSWHVGVGLVALVLSSEPIGWAQETGDTSDSDSLGSGGTLTTAFAEQDVTFGMDETEVLLLPPPAAPQPTFFSRVRAWLGLAPTVQQQESAPDAGLAPYGLAKRHACMDVVVDISEGVSHPLEDGEVARQLLMPLFPDVQLKAHLRYWEHNLDGSFTWVGEVDNDTSGTAIITVVDGKTSANIWDGNDLYVIQPDPSCGHVVMEANSDPDTASLVGDTPTPVVLPPQPPVDPVMPPGLSFDVAFLDIMFLYTSEAACARGGDTDRDDRELLG